MCEADCGEQGGDFFEVFDARFGLGAGGDIEGGGLDSGEGLGCVLRRDSSRKDDTESAKSAGVVMAEGPIGSLSRSAVDAGGVSVDKDGVRFEVVGRGQGEDGLGFRRDADGLDERKIVGGELMAIGLAFVAVKLHQIEEIVF